jgi:sugar (pentulose or hexulose) kinase
MKDTVQENMISNSEAILGFEFGSTRIKATLIDREGTSLASGSHGWENRLVDGIWIYDLEDVWSGAAACFSSLKDDVKSSYGLPLSSLSLAAAGFSGMMHGYLAFDREDNLMVPFRTWRNNMTEAASRELTGLFGFPIPQRWSIAHLWQAVLNEEEHVKDIAYLTTLSGYVHWKLTGRKVLGIGDASGMFPIDSSTGTFDKGMIELFDTRLAEKGIPWKLETILPEVLCAGDAAGALTQSGARLLDSSGDLAVGIPLCPPEGDAGTGMVATGAVEPGTGNVSAGTSVFAMVVLEKPLAKLHPEIDLVTTPDGSPVAMAHSNNCSSEIDSWVSLFSQAGELLGAQATLDSDPSAVYERLLSLALQGDRESGGLLSYGYHSGEHVTGFAEGRPLLVRQPDSRFSLENVMRSLLFSSLCALRTGLDILFSEGVQLQQLQGHGGFFKTPEVGQRIMAAATGVPVALPETAGEGGAWGMAVLAAWMLERSEKAGTGGSVGEAGSVGAAGTAGAAAEENCATLPQFLKRILAGSLGSPCHPRPDEVESFSLYYKRYHQGLGIEKAAVELLS